MRSKPLTLLSLQTSLRAGRGIDRYPAIASQCGESPMLAIATKSSLDRPVESAHPSRLAVLSDAAA
jgi:hypothetical protein